MTDGAAIIAKARSYIGKLHDGPDVPTLARSIAQTFPDLSDYCSEATNAMPWCGDFVAYVLSQFGIRPPPVKGGIGFFFVDRWLDFGTAIPIGQEQPGDVAIFLGSPHHVTFVAGGGTYVGGNQSDGVTETHYREPNAIRRPPAPGAVTQSAISSDTFTASGKGSWYSQYSGRYEWVDTGDAPGSAALGVPDDAQGVSFYDRSTLGHWFEVRAPNGVTSREQQTDIGPNPNTGRTIDISAAAAERFGYSPRNFPTDSTFSWRAIDPPAEVAGLSPQQQATKFRDLRKGSTMTDTSQPTPLPPLPSPLPTLQRPDMLANMMQYFIANPDAFERIASFMGALRGQPAPAAAPAAPAAAPTGLAAIIAHLSDGSNLSFWTGLGTILANVGLNAAGVVGSPAGNAATVAGQIMPTVGAALSAGGLFTKLASLASKIGPLVPTLLKLIAVIPK